MLLPLYWILGDLVSNRNLPSLSSALDETGLMLISYCIRNCVLKIIDSARNSTIQANQSLHDYLTKIKCPVLHKRFIYEASFLCWKECINCLFSGRKWFTVFQQSLNKSLEFSQSPTAQASSFTDDPNKTLFIRLRYFLQSELLISYLVIFSTRSKDRSISQKRFVELFRLLFSTIQNLKASAANSWDIIHAALDKVENVYERFDGPLSEKLLFFVSARYFVQ